ncbi:MAG: hypothetical protein N2690_03185 [Rhodocyclaceae bacterium]|nr:hypothetical protein [Rhodocyclaceae bacterium]
MDKGKMIAAIVERMKVRLDEDDPAFVLVELNRLALEATAKAVVDQLEPIPGKIEKAAAALLADVDKKATHRTAEAVAQATLRINDEVEKARATAAKLIEDVAKANRNVNASKWFAVAGGVGVVVAGLAFGGGYWLASTASENEALRAGQVFATPEGRAAARLAELGQARTLLECSGPGWTAKDGYCYGTAKDGKTFGWRVR